MFKFHSESVVQGSIRFILFCPFAFISLIDFYIIRDTWSNLSIGYPELTKSTSIPNIRAAILALNLFILVFLIICIYLSGKKELSETTLYLVALTIFLILIDIPREILVSKFVSCFNYTSHFSITLRLILKLIQFILILAFNVLNFILEKEKLKIVKLLNLIISLLVSLVILGLSINTQMNLKPKLTVPIEPKTIQIGFFNSKEIKSLENDRLSSDRIYNSRLIGNLSDILFSNNKLLARERCSKCKNGQEKCNCVQYYWHFYSIEINCDQNGKYLFKDCVNASSLVISMQYLDGDNIPEYNCAVKSDFICRLGCDNLLNEYKLILVQKDSINGDILLAWKGLCNCFQINKAFSFNLVSNMNVCNPN